MSLAQLKALDDPTPEIRVLPAPAATPAATKPKAKGGLNLGGLATATPKAKAAKETRPTIPGNEELEELADTYASEKPQLEALKGSVEGLRKQIIAHALPAWLQAAAKKPDTGSMNLHGKLPEKATDERTALLVSMQNRYLTLPEFSAGQERVLPIITRPTDTEEETMARFEQAFSPGLSISLSFEEIPEEMRQDVIDDLLPIFEKHGLMHKAEGAEKPAVVCKQVLRPNPGFHTLRHTLFTHEENLALHEVIPCVGMVKLTGLRK